MLLIRKMNSPVSTNDSEIDASVTFSEALMEQINRGDVKNMVTAQRDMLCRFEKTNEMLINFNILSANRFTVANNELKSHTQLMYDMKKDLDSIFKRIRVLKDRLNQSYPEAFKVCNVSPLLEDEEDEEELRVSSASQISDDQSSQSTNQQEVEEEPRVSSASQMSEDQSSQSTNQQESDTNLSTHHSSPATANNTEAYSSRGDSSVEEGEDKNAVASVRKETELGDSASNKTEQGQSG